MKIKNYPWFVPALVAVAQTVSAQSGSEDIRLTTGKSIVIDYPTDVARISTSNADVVDASPVTSKELLIHGKALGTVTLVVWNKAGQRNFYNINVEQNLEPLRHLLKETFPKDDIHLQSSRDSLSLTGMVASKEVAERATALSAPFAKTVVNNLQLAAAPVEKQILLRVKFAELDRNAASQFAINFVSTGATNTIGSATTGQFPSVTPSQLSSTAKGTTSTSTSTTSSGTSTTTTGSPQQVSSTFSISNALNIFAFRPDLNFGILLEALQSRGLLQILAEPNLVTTNGKEANFVVGGEFPVPVLQGGGNAGAVTVQFREYGVRLTFNPTITENHTIRMHVKPEVSTIDLANAVTLNGFVIPALATRKMETDIELGEGQSFVIAGLIDNRYSDTVSRIPGLASIPILGNFFKSHSENRSSTELIVMVTPEITVPLSPSDPKPSPLYPKPFLTPVTPSNVKTDRIFKGAKTSASNQ